MFTSRWLIMRKRHRYLSGHIWTRSAVTPSFFLPHSSGFKFSHCGIKRPSQPDLCLVSATDGPRVSAQNRTSRRDRCGRLPPLSLSASPFIPNCSGCRKHPSAGAGSAHRQDEAATRRGFHSHSNVNSQPALLLRAAAVALIFKLSL